MSNSDPGLVAELAQRLVALEREVVELRNAARARPTARTLRQDGTCPSCAGRRILHAPRVLDRGDSDASRPMALAKPSAWRSAVFGELEAYACVGCGWLEWYVIEPAQLMELPGKLEGFRLIDGEPAPGKTPYR